MIEINFFKLNATGNDFIAIDNRENLLNTNQTLLFEKMCTFKSGIGADGVLLLEKSKDFDFKMRYLNADGGEVEMCGNGARAITFFAKLLGIKKMHPDFYSFETMNGNYTCIEMNNDQMKLEMVELYDVNKFQLNFFKFNFKNSMYLNTGVPHCVFEVENLKSFPVFETGKMVRFNELFTKGANANFFEIVEKNRIRVRTYERGVENETLSCGTGVTATVIAYAKIYGIKDEVVAETLGGELKVFFNEDFSKVYLAGKVEKVFEGKYGI